MRNNIIRFLFIVVLSTAIQMPLLSQEKLKIAVVPKGKEAIFWKFVHGGVNIGAVTSKGVEIIWKAPQKEDDIAQQISIIEQCVNEGVSGIILSPINSDALSKPVYKAMKKKIPVLIFDSALKGIPGKDFVSFVGIDNRKAGKLAGENLIKLINGKGKVVLLRYVKGQANTIEREEGFLEAIVKEKDIELIEKDCYAGGTINEAKKASMSLIGRLKEADGIFCPNEISTMGMLFALRDVKLARKIKFIGFDITKPLVEALQNEEISMLVAQDPSRTGYQSVKAIVDYIRGKKIPSTIDIGIRLVTRENLNDPEIKSLYSMSSDVE